MRVIADAEHHGRSFSVVHRNLPLQLCNPGVRITDRARSITSGVAGSSVRGPVWAARISSRSRSTRLGDLLRHGRANLSGLALFFRVDARHPRTHVATLGPIPSRPCEPGAAWVAMGAAPAGSWQAAALPARTAELAGPIAAALAVVDRKSRLDAAAVRARLLVNRDQVASVMPYSWSFL
jgi:hypothetical protein